MKFGKQIYRASTLTPDMFKMDDWVDYKGLKKILKKIDKQNSPSIKPESQQSFLKSSPTERLFFQTLRRQVGNTIEVFINVKKAQLEKFDAFVQQDRDKESVSKCIQLHLSLCCVLNFAVLNYCAVQKILKKHDKVTGCTTKLAYMQKLMVTSPLACYPNLERAIATLEQIYSDVAGSSLSRTPVPESDALEASTNSDTEEQSESQKNTSKAAASDKPNAADPGASKAEIAHSDKPTADGNPKHSVGSGSETQSSADKPSTTPGNSSSPHNIEGDPNASCQQPHDQTIPQNPQKRSRPDEGTTGSSDTKRVNRDE